jgi:DHA1 family bicyclomycin/chloramphenicol resistance-like MFS transporter
MGAGATCLVVAATGMTVSAWVLGTMSPWAYFPLMYLIGVGNGLTMPGAGVRSISRHPGIAGAAAALSGFIQMAGGSIGTLAVILFAQGHAIELGLVMLGSTLTVFCAWVLVGRAQRGENTSPGDR